MVLFKRFLVFKDKFYFKIIFGVGILVLSLSFALLRKKSASPMMNEDLMRWPKFTVRDISGRLIQSADLKGRIKYVQFVRPVDSNNINLFRKVYSIWKNKISYIIMAKDYDRFISYFHNQLYGVTFIEDQYDELEALFKSTKYGKHYLFDAKGKTIYSAENNADYEQGIKKYLQSSVNKDSFKISEFVPPKSHIDKIPGFEQISELYKEEEKDYYTIALIASFCDSCASGPIIEALKRIHSRGDGKGSVFCILSNKFNNDVEIFKSQLQIEFPVVISDHNLSRRWNEFISRYTVNDVNNIVFVLNKSGRVEKILDPNCRTCWRPFFRWIDKAFLQKGR